MRPDRTRARRARPRGRQHDRWNICARSAASGPLGLSSTLASRRLPEQPVQSAQTIVALSTQRASGTQRTTGHMARADDGHAVRSRTWAVRMLALPARVLCQASLSPSARHDVPIRVILPLLLLEVRIHKPRCRCRRSVIELKTSRKTSRPCRRCWVTPSTPAYPAWCQAAPKKGPCPGPIYAGTLPHPVANVTEPRPLGGPRPRSVPQAGACRGGRRAPLMGAASSGPPRPAVPGGLMERPPLRVRTCHCRGQAAPTRRDAGSAGGAGGRCD
jgi:hypothetical protein